MHPTNESASFNQTDFLTCSFKLASTLPSLFLSMVAILSNCMVIWVLVKFPELRKGFNLMLGTLAAADCVSSLGYFCVAIASLSSLNVTQTTLSCALKSAPILLGI